MQTAGIDQLKYEDFPIKLFFRLLQKDDSVAHRILGKTKWEIFKRKWAESSASEKGEALFETKHSMSLAFVQMNKAFSVLRWLSVTLEDPKEKITEWGYTWHDDPIEMVEYLTKKANRALDRYEIETANVERLEKSKEEPEEEFNVDDALASLDMMGFTLGDHNTVTIGKYRAMSRVAERRLKQIEDAERKN